MVFTNGGSRLLNTIVELVCWAAKNDVFLANTIINWLTIWIQYTYLIAMFFLEIAGVLASRRQNGIKRA